uniref:Uncharacterized protein n=1 Tax=Rhizobium leguminosarum bv. trifolii TaxID=386 RepID=A0A1C9HZW3_RHILT|nr:hypothetical protein [Rhizobium leguminosarum bv. trifolii]
MKWEEMGYILYTKRIKHESYYETNNQRRI